MKVRQVKLAQAIRGETSLIIDTVKYDLKFEGNVLKVSLRLNPKNIGPFAVFPANIAYIEYSEEPSQEAVSEVVPTTKAKAKK